MDEKYTDSVGGDGSEIATRTAKSTSGLRRQTTERQRVSSILTRYVLKYAYEECFTREGGSI